MMTIPKRNEPVTDVIFRQDKKSKEIVAFFPDTYNHNGHGTMTCYAHVGQHSTAHVNYFHDETFPIPATEPSVQALMRELQDIGYVLIVRRRLNWKSMSRSRAR